MQVEAVDDKVTINAYIAGLWSGQFLFNLTQDPPQTMVEQMLRAQKHMNAEETLSARRSRAVQKVGGTSQASQPARQDRKRRDKGESSCKMSKPRREERRSPPRRAAEPERRYKHYTPLVATAE